MRKSKAIIREFAVSIFLLLASPCFAQFPVQDTADHGVMDTLYISCTAPDFFEKDSITVNFDLIFWTDATFRHEYLVVWSYSFLMTSSNSVAFARVILDERADGPVYKGTAVGIPNDWQARFNGAVPQSGVLPASVFYGAVQDFFPPQNAGPSLFIGTHILAHILIKVKDTTTIFIDTQSVAIPEGNAFFRNDGVQYSPLWIRSSCAVSSLTCLYKPGDANGDGKVDLADLIFMVNYIMKGGPAPTFECQADLNADKIVTLLDVVVAVNYLFKGGNPPLKSWACCL
ncbi:MAG: hypothetical protein RBG1_1C00001G0577 [candidate division Zixibacteria bacterium RBG-1]|nr:MAG: hypothetical protein RBG1_1C00001G0577 [candidate division Zixibacteria bacterium RBG-1]OGC83274.1 MAG: hypothetical protein A2V73_05520 [candidate division Zixibacteria bacterium RBG_19FT_COMBO_42_43]